MESIPFSYIYNHILALPLTVNGESHRFIFDTGIGLTVISKSLAERYGLATKESFSGKRMSGQEISIPLTTLDSIGVGSFSRKKVTVGIFDLSSPIPELRGIGGILSPGFLEDVVFQVNNDSKEIILLNGREDKDGKEAVPVPVHIVKEGPSLSIFVDAFLPTGRRVRLEVDSGSDVLILNSPLMEELNVPKDGEETKEFRGTDETGHNYVRYLSRLNGKISIFGREELSEQDPEVVFQDIIYDGLIGTSFLRRYNVTYDLSNSEMLFTKRVTKIF